MYQLGLVSVSFRSSPVEAVAQAAAQAGLSCVEWGSDVHCPPGDTQRQRQILALQKQYGISCCSYGTYFRLGIHPVRELQAYIQTAKALGTDTLRLWAGHRSPWEFSEQDRETLLADSKCAAQMAEQAGVRLCLECHKKTYTETAQSALELMQAVNSPAFRMYWQPNQSRSVRENLENAAALKDYVNRIHVFQWKGKERFPLESGLEEWWQYLQALPRQLPLLLEFMPDDELSSLGREADSLHRLVQGL